MHQARPQPNSPQRSRADLVRGALKGLGKSQPGKVIANLPIVLLERHDDAIAGPIVVQQEIAEWVECYRAERSRNSKRSAVYLRTRRCRGQRWYMTNRTADLLEQLRAMNGS